LQKELHAVSTAPQLALRLHSSAHVSEPNVSKSDRRVPGADRRKRSRSGRRASDPHVNWRRLAWLFAAYALYLSVRSLPETVRNLFNRPAKA